MGNICCKGGGSSVGSGSSKKKKGELIGNYDAVTVGKGDFISTNSGVRFSDVYAKGKTLGNGAFGEVKQCQHRDTQVIRAVKILKKDQMTREEQTSFQKETSVLKQLDHPNIIKLYEMFEDDRKYYVVQELCKGGELYDEVIKIGSFSEQKAAHIIKQILQAVAYCHEKGIVHRDIKPENILIDKEADNILKIIDFGTATEYNRETETLD